jgi:hypothetical protein
MALKVKEHDLETYRGVYQDCVYKIGKKVSLFDRTYFKAKFGGKRIVFPYDEALYAVKANSETIRSLIPREWSPFVIKMMDSSDVITYYIPYMVPTNFLGRGVSLDTVHAFEISIGLNGLMILASQDVILHINVDVTRATLEAIQRSCAAYFVKKSAKDPDLMITNTKSNVGCAGIIVEMKDNHAVEEKQCRMKAPAFDAFVLSHQPPKPPAPPAPVKTVSELLEPSVCVLPPLAPLEPVLVKLKTLSKAPLELVFKVKTPKARKVFIANPPVGFHLSVEELDWEPEAMKSDPRCLKTLGKMASSAFNADEDPTGPVRVVLEFLKSEEGKAIKRELQIKMSVDFLAKEIQRASGCFDGINEAIIVSTLKRIAPKLKSDQAADNLMSKMESLVARFEEGGGDMKFAAQVLEQVAAGMKRKAE